MAWRGVARRGAAWRARVQPCFGWFDEQTGVRARAHARAQIESQPVRGGGCLFVVGVRVLGEWVCPWRRSGESTEPFITDAKALLRQLPALGYSSCALCSRRAIRSAEAELLPTVQLAATLVDYVGRSSCANAMHTALLPSPHTCDPGHVRPVCRS